MQRLLLIGLVVVGLAGTAQAAEQPEVLKAQGGLLTTLTDSRQVVGASAVITGVAGHCGATACVVGLYDEDDIDEVTSADGVLEIGAAANTSFARDFPTTPIRLTQGLVAQSNGHESGVVVYTQQPAP